MAQFYKNPKNSIWAHFRHFLPIFWEKRIFLDFARIPIMVKNRRAKTDFFSLLFAKITFWVQNGWATNLNLV